MIQVRGKVDPMKRSGRFILYLIINILLSAATTLTVLWLWERAHSIPEVEQVTTTPMLEAVPTDQPEPTQEDIEWVTEDPNVIIRTVVGGGNLNSEYVEVFNQADGAVDLSGWQLVDESENQFTFPALILNNDGAVKVYSKAGSDTVIELYWQAETPIWQSGETVSLLDSDGNTISTYAIP